MSTVKIQKIIAIIVGDTCGAGGTAAISLAQQYKHLEIVLIDKNASDLQRAHGVISKFGVCSVIQSDLCKPQNLKVILDIINNPVIWVQYLINTAENFKPDPAFFKYKEAVLSDSLAMNKAIYEITQASLKNMIHNQDGRIENIKTDPELHFFIKKYPKDTELPLHTHEKGEIILVLDGVYSDEDGHSAAGEYLRNPPGSTHTPYTKEGCLILVILQDMHDDDQSKVRVNLNNNHWISDDDSVEVMPLHHFDDEYVALLKYSDEKMFEPWRHFHGGRVATLPDSAIYATSNAQDIQPIRLIQSNHIPFSGSGFNQKQ